MIVPVVSEEGWLAVLQDAPNWVPPRKPTLVISPHPDDETLGAGGLIAAQELSGVCVYIAAATDGEAAYSDSDAQRKALAGQRRIEQEEAVKQLGARGSIIRFGLPDSLLLRRESELEELLAPIINREMLVIAPWINDWHPDHEACATVAAKLCKEKGAELISYLFWTWHTRRTNDLEGANLLRFELTPELQKRKTAALACHSSQLQHASGQPVLPPELLVPAFRTFETFISHV